MLTFLVVTAIILVAAGLGAFAIPLLVVGAAVWLVVLPIKLLVGFVFGGLFRMVFWLFGALIGLILAPILAIVAVVGVVGALVAGLLALLAPLVPVVLLLLLGWAIIRLARPNAAAPQ
jgi:hypothetical protein